MPPAVDTVRGWMDIEDQLASTHPQDWASVYYEYLPLGKKLGMMTMHTEKMGNRTTESQVFNYWEKAHNQRAGAVIDVFSGPGLTNATAGASAVGDVRIIQMTAANAKLWNLNETMMITSTLNDTFVRIIGRVVDVKILGDADSYVAIILRTADSGSRLADASGLRFSPAGSAFPNKTELPVARQYRVAPLHGVASNRLASWSLTPHEIKEKSRISKGVMQIAMQDCLKDYLITKELGNLWGVLDESDPAQYESDGLYNILSTRTTAGYNLINFKTDTTYLGSTTGSFTLLGYQFLRDVGEYLSRWVGGGVWNCYCGGLALEAVQAMLTDRHTVEGISGETDEYGFRFVKVILLNGEMRFYQHPLFTTESSFQNTMVITRPEYLKTRVFLPFQVVEPGQPLAKGLNGQGIRVDGANWSTEIKGGLFSCEGLEVECADCHAIIEGVGLDIIRT